MPSCSSRLGAWRVVNLRNTCMRSQELSRASTTWSSSRDIATATQLANGSGLAKRITTWVDVGGVAAHSYQVAYTPFTYVVDEDSHVLIRGVANDWRGFESLLNEEGTLQAGKPWVPVSEPSPANR